ncbi:MAG: hypothetical protein JJE50_11295 [Actinomycetales bacterium]|nr:hypothetical protein [Actinomycetales bacterium]
MPTPGIPGEIVRAPMRTVKASTLEVYAQPRRQLARLADAGRMLRLGPGIYTAVPDDRVGTGWAPTLETAAAALSTAIYGARVPVLMGLSAARIHQAIPRAIGVALVAVPGHHRAMALPEQIGGLVRFVTRDVGRLDAELVSTELGQTLVTTPEQTILDLTRRPDLGGLPNEAASAVQALLARADENVLASLAQDQRMRATLARVRRHG